MDRRWTNFGTKLVSLFTKEKSGYNKGKVFQSNMSKNTVDGNCMTEKMLKVMLSTKSARGEKIIPMNKKKVNKNIYIFLSI